MLALSIRYLPIAIAVTVLAACHGSGGGDPPTADTTAPSIPVDVAAAATSPTSVGVTWSAASDAGGSGVKEYVLYRGSTTIATVTTTSYTDSGLAANTQYSYQVSARDNANNDSNRSAVVIVTTLAAPDTTPPSVPTGLTAAATSATAVNVSWSAATDPGGSGVKDYLVYRGGVAVATVTTTSFADSGLTANMLYAYQISARDNTNNESSRSAVVSATTLAAPDTTPPSMPTGLTAAATSATTVNVSWSAATDPGGSGVKDYIVYRGSVAVATVTTTSFVDSGLTASTLYAYQISARDNALNESAHSVALSVTTPAAPDTTPPSAPATLTASAVSSTQINLSWGAATDNAGVTGYRLERCIGAACTFAQYATPTGLSFSDTGLTDSTLYSYRVRAADAANNLGAFSNTASATTPDATPPSAPGTLTASATSPTQIGLSWGAATDNVAVTGYLVERCTGAGCSSFAPIATPTGLSFSDTGLTASTSYSYRVRAVDAVGNSGAFSNTGSTTTQASADTTPPSAPATLTASAVSSTQINLSWGAATDDVAVTGYRVERCSGAGCITFAQIATPAGTSFSDTGLTASTSYSYRVRATDAASNLGAFSNTSSATTQAASTWGLDTRPSNSTCVAPVRTIGSSTITISEFFNNGLSETVAATQAPGDNSRWYMVERNGRIMTFTVTNKNPTVFLDLSSAVNTDGDQEAGVLGLAFHPNFANNNKLYVFYSGAPTSGSYTIQSRIAEFTATNRTTASAATERVLIRADKFYTNHNGGQLAFGPDGLLYASLGDGGLGDDPVGNGQSQLTLFGKIIRIDVNGTTGSTGYAIPPGNPNFGNTTCPLVASGQNLSTTSRAPAACPELYAWGLRNPWRFSLDRGSASPDLWVGDVGQSAYEEINRVQLGGNYGWDVREGTVCHEPSSGCASAGLINPIVAAPRSSGMFAIIGGFVYRGQAIPSLAGRYLFTDYFNSGIQTYDASATNGYTTVLNDSGATVSAFAEGNDGELYLVDYFGGRLLSINPGSSGGAPPVPSLLSQTGCVVPGTSQPASGLVPYTPNAPFWSDGANKERWMGLPNSTLASVAADGDWQLPTGTVLMKNFRLQSGQLIETRLLMRHPDGEWAGYTYQWNGAETEATRLIGGGTVPVGTPSQNWIYPSEAQCLQCHTSAAGRSLGLETLQLNGSIFYPLTGRTANQITTLAHIGILPSSMPDASTLPALPAPQGSAALGTRARAYLHTNCSFCHRPGGGAPGNLDLRYDTPIGATNICNATPTVSDLGVAGAKLVKPADPAASVLYLRMNRRGANQMPPIGSNLVDTDGAALLQQWISQMDNACN